MKADTVARGGHCKRVTGAAGKRLADHHPSLRHPVGVLDGWNPRDDGDVPRDTALYEVKLIPCIADASTGTVHVERRSAMRRATGHCWRPDIRSRPLGR